MLSRLGPDIVTGGGVHMVVNDVVRPGEWWQVKTLAMLRWLYLCVVDPIVLPRIDLQEDMLLERHDAEREVALNGELVRWG